MSAKWKYEDGNVAYADGTGTYEEGWYAATALTVESGQSPELGPFGKREQAVAAAEELEKEDQTHMGD